MIFDGKVFRVNRKLGYRYAQRGDVYRSKDRFGDQIPNWHVVFFRIKDAAIYEKEGIHYYDGSSVPADKLIKIAGHTLTNMAIGLTVYRTGQNFRDLRYSNGRLIMTGDHFSETPLYLMKGGSVYMHTIRRPVSTRREDMG